MITTIDLPRGERSDLLLEATPDTRLGAIAGVLGRLRPAPAAGGDSSAMVPVLYVDRHALDPGLSLGDSPIREGSVVSLDDPAGCLPEEPGGAVELHVTGGPAAGAVHQLATGATVVGSGAGAQVRVADPHLALEAFVLEVGAAGDCELALAPGVRARLEGGALAGRASWPPGTELAVGGSLFELRPPARADAVLTPSADGCGLDYNRPPRVRPGRPPALFRLPAPPGEGSSGAFPIAMVLSSLLLPAGAALIFGQPAYLLLALLGPVVWIVQHLVERRQGRTSHARQVAEYEARCAQVEADADRALAAERTQRRRDFPDPAHVLLTAIGPRSGLWERRRDDPDFLSLRVGTGTVDSNVRLEDPGQADERRTVVSHLVDSPVVVRLPERGVLGVAGAGELPRALGRWLMAQVVTLHSPLDVRVCVLTDATGERDWEWVRWLPHARPALDPDVPVAVGNDDDSVAGRLGELTALLAGRLRAGRETGSGRARGRPDVLVVVDGARRLRGMPGMVQLLREGPAVGIYALCLDEDERRLPAECQALVVEDGWALRVQQAGAPAVEDVRRDLVGLDWCQRLARGLAPLRDISDRDGTAGLPASARLLETLDLEPPTAEAIAARWRRSPGSTRAVIGVGADGPFAVDLDVRHDGPHGLVAGTTGSGKSELLQTLIASLAVANRPDEMTFVLVDYKGGAAFADCARLPHTVGMVTDLDGHLTRRALESLAAELRRREELLGHAGAKDVEAYADLRATGAGLPPLPRLVIVIDEFASLVAELPDFVAGLVDIARRGRSLGVHLILATQRPAGVVTADIRANTNMRIALRVTDAAESADVIEAPDAARIPQSTPGRCYVRSGTSPLRAVQAARVGGRRPGAASASAERAARLVPLPWAQAGRRLPSPPAVEDESTTLTDLRVLVEAIREAAAREGIAGQPSPWLPPLPDTVTLGELPDTGPAGAASIPFGLTDLPAAQARRALALDLASGGHLAIVGSPQSGRSAALRTIAGSLATRVGPADVHLYAIDCGASALLPLAALPHCGAVVGRAEVDRVERLLARLRHEVGRRQQLLAAAGFSGVAEQRERAGERLPWMLLMLDRWEGFVAAYENYDYGRLVEEFVHLLREGPGAGLRAVVTGDRSLLTGQVSTVFDRRLVMRLADPADYGAAGIGERSVPEHMPPGRALSPEGGWGGLRESQVALLDADPSGTAQVAAVQRLARAADDAFERPPRPLRPLHVDALPAWVTAAEALALDPDFAAPSALWALVGAGGDQLGPAGVDLVAEGPGFVVAGPPRSGRSTALLTMARSLLARGVPVVLVSPRRSPLRALAGAAGVLAVLDAETGEDALRAVVEDHPRCAVVVDDAELLRDTPLDDVLSEVLRRARDSERAVIVAGVTDDLKSSYRGFLSDALRSRSGLMLAVRSPDEGDLFGVRLPRNVSASGPRGRALLIRLGSAMPVQVAAPDESRRSNDV